MADQLPARPPAKINTIGALTLVGGIFGVLTAMAMALGTIFLWCPWVYSLVMGILAIVKGARMIGAGAEYEPAPKAIAIMQIVNVINCDIINLTLGIISLVMQGDPEVRDWYED